MAHLTHVNNELVLFVTPVEYESLRQVIDEWNNTRHGQDSHWVVMNWMKEQPGVNTKLLYDAGYPFTPVTVKVIVRDNVQGEDSGKD